MTILCEVIKPIKGYTLKICYYCHKKRKHPHTEKVKISKENKND